MSLEELSKYTTVSKYACWLEKEKRREVWEESVSRYKGMLLEKYPNRQNEIEKVCKSIYTKKVMPSMRALQFGGYPMMKRNERGYNCTGSYVDRLAFFHEAMYLLLCGSGVGFSVQNCHTKYLPFYSHKRMNGVELPKKVYKIPDSIEGWALAHAVLLSSFHTETIIGYEDYLDCDVEFDLSEISPKGCPLSGGVGTTPGPEPLANSLSKCKELLLKSIGEGYLKMDSLTATDYVMHQADAVLAGGVRRSACSAVFDLWDARMFKSKTGNWFKENPQRARANISAALIRETTKFDAFYELFQYTKQFGEPGFWWTDHEDCIPNPCFEIGFFCRLNLHDYNNQLPFINQYRGPIISGYVSGWQMCNLCTINGSTVQDPDDFYERCTDAAKLGTWQAGFTDFKFLGRISEEIVRKEALLGVSISGMMHKPEIFLNKDVLLNGANTVRLINSIESKEIGINEGARITAVKPDGNSASALACFAGCGPGKMRKGFRIARANKEEAPYKLFKLLNPVACEESYSSANRTDDVIRFPVEYEGIIEDDVTAIDCLNNVKLIYENWIIPGKREELCVKSWLSNNVSNTVSVKENEWDEVANFIFNNKYSLAGVSLVSKSLDKDYVQAPFTAVYNEEEQKQIYGETDQKLLQKLCDDSIIFQGGLWKACADALHSENKTEIDYELPVEEVGWMVDLNMLALRFFNGDVRKATYCVKDYYNWQLFCLIKSKIVPVDYHYCYEERNNVNLQGEAACMGGSCEV